MVLQSYLSESFVINTFRNERDDNYTVVACYGVAMPYHFFMELVLDRLTGYTERSVRPVEDIDYLWTLAPPPSTRFTTLFSAKPMTYQVPERAVEEWMRSHPSATVQDALELVDEIEGAFVSSLQEPLRVEYILRVLDTFKYGSS